jgi:competence protein ComFB
MAKKTFDKELMYKKIMPSASRQVLETDDQETQQIKEINETQKIEKIPAQNETVLFQNKEIKWITENPGESILYNITERLVMNRLEIALKKMNCCRCDRCKKDIVALTLNQLPPLYVVCTSDEIDGLLAKNENLGLQVTSAILKAILTVRKSPRH